MTYEALIEVISEAERFIRIAKLVPEGDIDFGSKRTAAAKRASMDLTRALSRFRNG